MKRLAVVACAVIAFSPAAASAVPIREFNAEKIGLRLYYSAEFGTAPAGFPCDGGYSVSLIPEGKRVTLRQRKVRGSVCAPRIITGSFSLAGLPPGRYVAVAVGVALAGDNTTGSTHRAVRVIRIS
jgi:hypothetical protein